MNFSDIITKIGTTLAGVDSLEEVYNYPVNNIKGFPACVYLPVSHTNNLISNQNNQIEHSFKIWVVVKAEELRNSVVTDYLAPAVDEVIQAFREEWDFDTSGVIVNLTNSNWTSTVQSSGYQVQAELDLTIKSLDNLN